MPGKGKCQRKGPNSGMWLVSNTNKAVADSSRRIIGHEIRKVTMECGGGADLVEPCRLL